MLSFLRRKSYEDKAIDQVKVILIEALGEREGGTCHGAFSAVMYQETVSGAFSPDVIEFYKRSGLTHEEAALSMLDGCVTNLKAATEFEQGSGALAEVIKGMERTIDLVMRKRPSRVLPRNGKFAQGAEAAGLDRFFRQTRP